MDTLQAQIAEIQARNARVEADKAWERSWIRRGFIALTTYVFALLWLLVIHSDRPFLTALIPSVGYVLSTISLRSLQQRWLARKKQVV
ncbi:MAG: hypothetical protein WCV85_03060 [Patescibacteria group bacterium]